MQMKIIEMFKNKKPVIAFEIFPPKPDVPLETIYDHLDQFEALKPDYISVTYAQAYRHGARKDVP